MILFSGARIEPLSKFDGRYADAAPTLVDIALGLGRIPRFGGQGRCWWSGIHHAFVCRIIARDMGMSLRVQLLCLLHDAHEAVTGDVPAFYKPRELSEMQEHIDKVYFTSIGVWPLTPAERVAIKVVDDRALKAEAEVVGPPNISSHLEDPLPKDTYLVQTVFDEYPSPLDTDGIDCKAAQEFYRLYSRLIGDAVTTRRNDTNR